MKNQMPQRSPEEADLHRLDPAWGAAAYGFRTGWRVAGGTVRARSLQEVHEALERRRKTVAAGNSLGILLAIADCAAEGLPLPAWLAEAFSTRIEAFVSDPAAPTSLDDVFHSPNLRAGKPKRTRKDRSDWHLGAELWKAVRAVAGQHRGLDPALDAVLAAGDRPVRKVRARELVLRMEEAQVALAGIRPLSKLWRRGTFAFEVETPKQDAPLVAAWPNRRT